MGLLPLLVLILAMLAAPAPARPEALHITGPSETVFDWDSDRCARWDIPDAPARAWRGADGRVRMLSAAEEARLSLGPDLHGLTRSCDVVHAGRRDDDPGAHDDRSWLASPHVDDEGGVMALAHVEFHGHARPELCLAGTYSACWWNTIVELRSGDGGASFPREGASDLVAALPYRYAPDQGRRKGYFNPSNIIARNGYLHAFVFAEAAGAQRRGACLIRRPAGGGAADWRAWDGNAFEIRFVDPYREAPADPAAHVCSPLPGLSSTISAVVRHEASGLFLAVTPATLRDAGDGTLRSGIWWTASEDLLRWSRPRLLVELPLLWRRNCAVEAAHAYPSLLDPDSRSANFETVDDDFWLYLVRIRLEPDCSAGPRRDLIRLPVSWRGPGQAGTAP